jgi:gamma-glutamyl hercynylcysteine S-oxide synthase
VTGLVAAPAVLAEWAADVVDRTLELIVDLDEDQLIGPQLPTVNPLLWEIAHLAWFQEKFVLRQACGRDPILPYGDALYDSGAVPHDTRWRLALPSLKETKDYMRTVAERVIDELTRPGVTDVVQHFTRYTIHHYDVHTEALTYTRQTLGYRPPVFAGLSGTWAGEDQERAPVSGDVSVAGGEFLLGAVRSDPFVYDNEKWGHRIEVAPFSIARTATTQAEFAAFVEAGGYRDTRVWADGGAWAQTTGAEHPAYWRGGPGGWQRRHFDTWLDLEPDLPVCHVSWREADAYCRWAGRRLPSEAEWEFAATGGACPKPVYPWGDAEPGIAQAATDWRSTGPAPVSECAAGDSPVGCRQMIGNVWEWTASDFAAYPNFERDAYWENSEQFFGSRKVLRGGAWATRARFLRSTMRNYFTPDRRDVLAGLRTCAVS